MYQIVKHYRNNDSLRKSFNALAQKVFDIDFEPWYQGGFWTDRYDPYSIVEDGEVIANVSVNRMEMLVDGKKRNWIQLGTVMTDPRHRNRGLIRGLMIEIQNEFADAEGMLLYANDSVLDFYPKFGFRKASEYAYWKEIENPDACFAERISMDSPSARAQLLKAMEQNCFRTGCDMLDNAGLMFFYILDYLGESVFYIKELDAWAIAQSAGQTLQLIHVFAGKPVSLDAVLRAFGGGYREVVLGFAPEDPKGWKKKILQEQDSTFFVKGDIFTDFEAKALRLPLLARA